LALQGEAACYYHDKQFDMAAPMLERIASIERTIHGNEDVRYGWALMNLSDVYRKLSRHDKSETYYDKCVQIFRKVNIERILAEQQSRGTLTPAVQAAVYKHMFGRRENENLADSEVALQGHRNIDHAMQCLPSERSLAKSGPWILISSDQIDPPAWLWLKPTISQKATIVCIHGLGLNARTFEALAKQLTPRGFTVLAMDMRGFGTYASAKGKEQLDFEGSFDDLATVLGDIRRDRPNEQIFILGESMGGAIALQFTAKHPELVDGLICSVPAGTRYKQKKTELRVAVRLVKAKNKPFDIGRQIVSQATQKESLKSAWQNDPFNRLQLTPKELIEFQSFMAKNKSAATKIKNRPVIFFQGGQDKLVKAQGTVEIFKEVASADKDLVVLGSSEHLIFEEGQFGPAVVYGVVGWMLAHLEDQDKLTATKL
jgi:alpha-beta hydrolase superfamily lysophospholipase